MKRLLIPAAAIVLALVMNGAALADGHGKGHGGWGNGWYGGNGWYYWGNPGRYEWEDRWYGDYGPYRYNNYYGFANPWYGYGSWNNVLSYLPGALAQGYLAPVFQSAGALAPSLGSIGAYAPAAPTVAGTYAPAAPAVPGYAQNIAPAAPGYAQTIAPAAPGYAQTYAPAAPVAPAPRVQVVVPNPEAQLVIGGAKMESLGMVRMFELPPVEQGKSDTYKVTATWVENGSMMTDVRKVAVTTGSVASVDFTKPAPIERVSAPVKNEPDTQNVNTPSKNATPP